MFLRRLAVRGFKSFADRTVFDFSPGVSVIVGPNGSGKSNLIDAIAWVLGEQGPKALRGGKMEDVIFAGTPTRSSLGRAEVELTIDNSAGVLPIDFTEVTVRRTLFRSGESEYAVNGTPCRLLDIQELLSDTGVGRELHTIVGQGQLDEILSGKPEDRRAAIEEAAGLLKHRRRKDRALRKLERVDGDIERLHDVISELRRQIRPLERQAEVAKRASEIESELRELKLKLWVLEYTSVTGEEDAEAERRAAEEVEQLSRAVTDAAARADALERDLRDAARGSEAILATEFRLAAVADRFESLARFADERRKHLEDLATREPRGEAPTTEEIVAAAEVLAEARAARERAEQEAHRAETDRAAVQSAREEAARAREEIVHLNGERAALRAAVEGAEEERRRLVERRAVVASASETAAASLVEVRNELERLEREEETLAASLDAAEGARDTVAARVEELIGHQRDLERTLDALGARKALLDEEIARLDDPASALAGQAGIEGRVIEQVRAHPGYERALRAALGSLADAVLSESRARAMAALDRLKRDGGRATIAVPGASIYSPVPMGVRPLLQVVENAGPYADVVRGLLSGIAVADTLAEAAEMAHAHPALVIVTTDGDRLGANVVAGGAAIDARDPREDARAAQEQIAETTERLDAARREVEHARADLQVHLERVEAIADRLNEIDASTAGATERLAQLEREAHAGAREDSVLAGRLAELEERLADDVERLRSVETRLSRAVSSEPSMDAATMAQVERLAAERALRLGEATERERAAAVALTDMEARARKIKEDRARWEAGREAWTAGARRAALVAEAARAIAAKVAAWVQDARAVRMGGEQHRAALEHALGETRVARRAAESGLEDARRRAHESDLRRAERSHRIASLLDRLRQDYDLSPDEAMEAVRPDPADGEEMRRRAATLERRLALLGRVNPIAMEQYQSLVDRHAFLMAQVDDLRKSRKDLMSVVHEVDRKIVEVFDAAFSDIAAEFESVFQRLFPGGEGRLVLTDPDDLLTSGVDVEARPAGKRVKRVSLLSGGERALTAVALLFAIFRARPSPFYLLDEVEAALDDMNLHRFLEIASEFRDRSQLLVVTHQKRTMEIADALYGISMGREGVSKVICERLDRESRAGESIPLQA